MRIQDKKTFRILTLRCTIFYIFIILIELNNKYKKGIFIVNIPKHSLRMFSKGSDGYGRIPTKACSFILKYSLWHSLRLLPDAKANASIPPVLVPATQSKQCMIGLPTIASRFNRICTNTRPLIPPPSRQSNLKNY